MVFTPTELDLVNFDDLIRTADLFRTALHKHQHGFSAKRAPVRDGMFTEAMFVLNLVG
jgi:hypothetical protein